MGKLLVQFQIFDPNPSEEEDSGTKAAFEVRYHLTLVESAF